MLDPRFGGNVRRYFKVAAREGKGARMTETYQSALIVGAGSGPRKVEPL